MDESKKAKRNVIECIVPLVFSVAALVLSLLIGDKMARIFDSVIDKYINYTPLMIFLAAIVINGIFFVIFLVFFILGIVRIIKQKDAKKNIILIILMAIFAVINVAFFAGSPYITGEKINATDLIGVVKYVDIHDVFDIDENDSSYSEQTIINRTADEVPVNYEFKQTASGKEVSTQLTEITDKEVLSAYYDEQRDETEGYAFEKLNSTQLENLSATVGCIGEGSNSSLVVLLVKDDTFYKVYIKGDQLPKNDELIKLLETL